MAPEIQALVPNTQAWLRHSWHVQVPFTWLEACVNWLLEEAGGPGQLSQQQINQQVLDQWLLTDLRDLDHPVLPDGISQAQKTELGGTFCVQMDSLLDISQPAYSQLQRWRGTDCGDDAVSAVTQDTQKPWEIKTTRMLLLQVTDGVQSLEAMEYQPIAALNTALRPGTKLLLQGKMVCRLGVLLLGPANVKILGGEVEDLAERNNQGRVLCRTLGLPEEQQQEEEAPLSPHQGNQEVVDEELDDQELLASLEADGIQVWPDQESGYGTQASGNSTVRSHVSTLSTRSSFRSGSVQSSRASVDQPEDSDLSSNFQEITGHHMADDEFPDEDFDDLPLDELDVVLAADSTNVTAQFDRSHSSTLQANRVTANPNSYGSATKPQTGQCDRAAQPQIQSGSGSQLGSGNKRGCAGAATGQLAAVTSKPDSSPAPLPNHDNDHFLTDDEGDFMDDDMDRFIGEVESNKQQTGLEIACSSDHAKGLTSGHLQCNSAKRALTLTSPPFIYLCLLQESKPHPHSVEIRVKAFIVTLLGKLSGNNGVWRVGATISDGTGYMDVELSDQVLTGLLGFSVAEKEALKRDPARRGQFEAGKKRCQEELVDMCCVMTIEVEPEGRRAVVTKAEPVKHKVLQELEHRVRGQTR